MPHCFNLPILHFKSLISLFIFHNSSFPFLISFCSPLEKQITFKQAFKENHQHDKGLHRTPALRSLSRYQPVIVRHRRHPSPLARRMSAAIAGLPRRVGGDATSAPTATAADRCPRDSVVCDDVDVGTRAAPR